MPRRSIRADFQPVRAAAAGQVHHILHWPSSIHICKPLLQVYGQPQRCIFVPFLLIDRLSEREQKMEILLYLVYRIAVTTDGHNSISGL